MGYLAKFPGGAFGRMTLVSNTKGSAVYDTPPYVGPTGSMSLTVQELYNPANERSKKAVVVPRLRLCMNDNGGNLARADIAPKDPTKYVIANRPGSWPDGTRLNWPDAIPNPSAPVMNETGDGGIMVKRDGTIGVNSLGLASIGVIVMEGIATLASQPVDMTGWYDIELPKAGINIAIGDGRVSQLTQWDAGGKRLGQFYFNGNGSAFQVAMDGPSVNALGGINYNDVHVVQRGKPDYGPAVTRLREIAHSARYMDMRSINGFRVKERNRTWMGERNLANMRLSGASSVTALCKRAQASGVAYKHNATHLDTIEVIQFEAAEAYSVLPVDALPVDVEFSNETWNYVPGSFQQSFDLLIMAVRAGLLLPGHDPDDLTDKVVVYDGNAYPIMPSTVPDLTDPEVSGVYTARRAFAIGEQIWLGNGTSEFQVNVPIGGTFRRDGADGKCTPKYTFEQCVFASERYKVSKTKQLATAWRAAAAVRGHQPPTIVLAGQLGQWDSFERMLRYNNAADFVDAVAQGHYFGNIGGNRGGDVTDYNSVTPANFQPVTKNLVYRGGSTATEGYLLARSALVAALEVTANAMVDQAVVFNGKLFDLNDELGKSIRSIAYEGQLHAVNDASITSWPCQQPAWASGTTYANGKFVRYGAGVGAIYQAKNSPPAGTLPTNAAYWDVFCTNERLSDPVFSFNGGQSNPANHLIANYTYDPAWPGVLKRLFKRWDEEVGDEFFFYQKLFRPWGVMENEAHLGDDNPIWKALAEVMLRDFTVH